MDQQSQFTTQKYIIRWSIQNLLNNEKLFLMAKQAYIEYSSKRSYILYTN